MKGIGNNQLRRLQYLSECAAGRERVGCVRGRYRGYILFLNFQSVFYVEMIRLKKQG